MKLNNNQINEILKKYNIGNFKSKALLYNRWNTAYYLKTTKGDFLLKILNHQTEKELKKEIMITNRLKNEIPSSFPIMSKDHKQYVKKNGLIILIKNFIKGKPVLKGEKLSNKNLAQLGEYYAIIHKTKDISNIPKKDLYTYLKRFFSGVDKLSPEYKIARATLNLLESHSFNSQNFPKGLIHADLHTENILVKNDKIVAILDFEDAHVGSFIYDLGICIIDTCWKRNDLSKERINILVSGYESIRKLTKKEKEHLIDSAILVGVYALHFLIIKNGTNKKNLNGYFVRRFLKLQKKFQ